MHVSSAITIEANPIAQQRANLSVTSLLVWLTISPPRQHNSHVLRVLPSLTRAQTRREMETTAEETEEGFTLRGSKTWITNAPSRKLRDISLVHCLSVPRLQ